MNKKDRATERIDRFKRLLLRGDITAYYVRREGNMVFIEWYPEVMREGARVEKKN